MTRRLLPRGAVCRQYKRNFVWLTVMAAGVYLAAGASAVVSGFVCRAVRAVSSDGEVLEQCKASLWLLQVSGCFFIISPVLMGYLRFTLPLSGHMGRTAHPGILLDAFSSAQHYLQSLSCGVLLLWMWGMPAAFLYASARLVRYYAVMDPGAALLLTADALALAVLLCTALQRYMPVPFLMAQDSGLRLFAAVRQADTRFGDLYRCEMAVCHRIPSACALAVSCMVPWMPMFCVSFPVFTVQGVLLFSAITQRYAGE